MNPIVNFIDARSRGQGNELVYPTYKAVIDTPRQEAARKIQANWRGAKQRRVNYRDFFVHPPMLPGASIFAPIPATMDRWTSYVDYVRHTKRRDDELRRKAEERRRNPGFYFGGVVLPQGLPQLTRDDYHRIEQVHVDRWKSQNCGTKRTRENFQYV